MELLRNFTGLNKGDAHLAGGKGASLGEMTQAGIPVPPGFVVLADSFEQFIRETDLVQEIDSILHKVNHKEIHTVEGASEVIRALILNAEMPKDIADEISSSFKKLDTKYVAVRSSATAEDGMDHAWAGQLESYLNTTEDDVLTKVKLCWSSLFTPRAIFYRFEKGLHSTKISVAVVVQKMVESEVSGIAFSVHPVTEDYNQLIIEAGFGLGEAIVSGSVTPDSYVVEKEPRNILDINISTQDRALYRAEVSSKEHGNNEWRDIPEPKASSQVLTKEQILELSEIILKIENHYGFPCDIEWAFEKGKFYIVQSRPITTLSKKPLVVHPKNYPVVWEGTKLNWVKFLERKRTPFIYFPFIEIEAQRMPDICGFRFFHHLYKWTGDTGVHFRVAEEFVKCDAHFLSLIKNNDSRIKEWAHKGYEVQKLADKWLDDFAKKPIHFSVEVFDRFYEDFIQILLYTATMPYLVLSTLDNELTKGSTRESFKEILDLYEPLRNTSKYPELERTILNSWFNSIGKKYEIDPVFIHFMTPNEIREIETKGINREELVKRKKWSVLWNTISDNQLVFSFDSSIEKDIPVLNEYIESTDTLKGATAFPGYAKGVVRIVNIQEDVKEFNQGDILVSLNTNPDLIPIIKKAGAIVTDEGGIMCHAAIVSREFKIPCVIGTKIATKVLKDGDMVEVDADKGIVRILSESLNKEDYYLNFKAKGPGLYFVELGTIAYDPNEVINIVKDGLVFSFYSKKAEKQNSEFAKQKDFLKIVTESKKEIERIDKKYQSFKLPAHVVTIEKFDEIHKNLLDSCSHYKYVNNSYLDTFVSIGNKEEVMKIGQYKNEMQKCLFNLLFSETSPYKEILRNISTNTNLPYSDIEQYHYVELISLITKDIKLDGNTISQRKNIAAITKDTNGKIEFVDAPKATNLFDTLYGENLDQSVLKGITGHTTGEVVSGKVKIIHTDYKNTEKMKKEMAEMEQGQILVSQITAPELMPAIKKAKAIVTDIGGMLSHAAIISRELNIPCVIGTKNASEVLKDEDVVEVDADKGIVKIIRLPKDSSETRSYKVVRSRKLYVFPGVWNYESESQEATLKLHGARIETVWTNWENGMFTAVFDENEWERVGKYLAKRMQEDPAYLEHIYKKQKKVGEAAIISARKIIAMNLEEESEKALIEILEELKTTWIGYDHINTPPWFIGGDYYQSSVLDILTEKYKLSASEIEKIITPPVPSFSHEEEILLYQAALATKDDKNIQELAEKLSDKFYWIPFGYDGPQQNTKEEYVKKIQIIAEKNTNEINAHLKNLESLQSRTIEGHSQIIKKHAISDADLNLIRQIYTLAEMTDWRKEVTFQLHVAVWAVLSALAKKYKIEDHNILRFVSVEELKNLDHHILLDLIKERQSGLIHITHKAKTEILTGEKAQILRKKLLSPSDSTDILKGKIGSRGKNPVVTGSVKVVMHPSEMDKVKEGDILVATMTTPEYVPAMRKAIAILTDEGGVTCHAAIVSRELGLPAIIAIGNATKVLKDGDKVEIDVEKGVVKILK